MPAPGEAWPQVGLLPENGSQEEVVLEDETANLAPAVPTRPELEMLLDPYRKNARLSLMTLNVFFCMPASLPDRAPGVDGFGRGLFFRNQGEDGLGPDNLDSKHGQNDGACRYPGPLVGQFW
jgi:hypothetical protein